jgi:transitional endoplasmic reticulum ATPase
MYNPSEQGVYLLTLRVVEARGRDVGRGLARVDPCDLESLGIAPGQTIEIVGKRTTVARAMPVLGTERGRRIVQVDGITRDNALVGLDEQVVIRPITCELATRVKVKLLSGPASPHSPEEVEKYLGKLLDGVPVVQGDIVRVQLFGASTQEYTVIETEPKGAVLIQLTTKFELGHTEPSMTPERATCSRLAYEDIGGLKREVALLRELIEIPFKHPEVFQQLGIEAPRGILLNGPPGVGKSLMARVVAESCQANFFRRSGLEIIKSFSHSGSSLEDLFHQARSEQPAIIFIDEIDAIASQRNLAEGQIEKRIVAELLALLDNPQPNDHIVIIASTTNADALDPPLRRHGRFERQINVGFPGFRDRIEILEIHSRGMPLADDVDFRQLAELTRGFVGADLFALCQEAALSAMRERIVEESWPARLSLEMLATVRITMAHFLAALRTISALVPQHSSVELLEVGWENVGGLDDVRQQLIEAVIMPLRHPKLFTSARARPMRGVLLHGPSGTGKTLLARALASETGINFISIRGLEMVSLSRPPETVVREAFHRAKQLSPSIIFLDDLDSIAPSEQRREIASLAERVFAELVSEIDRLEQLRGVVVLAATKNLQSVPPELLSPGRFELLLDVPVPNGQALKEIFQIHLRGRPLTDEIDLSGLVRLAQGFTGADIEAVCQQAAIAAIKEHVASRMSVGEDQLLIAQRHLALAIEEVCVRKLQER